MASEWIQVTERDKPGGVDHQLCYQTPHGLAQCVGYWNRIMRIWFVNGEPYGGLIVTHYRELFPYPHPTEEATR